MKDLPYCVPSSPFGRCITRVAAVSIGLAVSALVVGVPLGYFEVELIASLGHISLLIPHEVLLGLAYFLTCFPCARKWPGGAAPRTLLAFVVVKLLSVPLVVGTSAGFPPAVLLLLSVAIGAACALLGAMAGA